jgi:hypothetical protein
MFVEELAEIWVEARWDIGEAHNEKRVGLV